MTNSQSDPDNYMYKSVKPLYHFGDSSKYLNIPRDTRLTIVSKVVSINCVNPNIRKNLFTLNRQIRIDLYF